MCWLRANQPLGTPFQHTFDEEMSSPPDLRPVTLDDVSAIADLETSRTPDDPHDAAMVAYWWTHDPDARHALRLIGDGVYLSARHGDWEPDSRRYGVIHVSIQLGVWNPDLHRGALEVAEAWLRAEMAEVGVVKTRADFESELRVAREHGYREVREERFWELDLRANRDALLVAAEESRAVMRRQGIDLLTLDQDDSSETIGKLYALDVESTRDIPTTVPVTMPPLDEWYRNYFENPGVRKDRFWIARLGDDVVGMSLIEYPPGRGVPKTAYTGTSPRFRGRGIARGLKYETIAQAIAVGATRVRTDNDSENAPILHLNSQMGYQPMTPTIELHRPL
jgi:GNAT superfamily N-acetyltransferase